MSGRRIQSDGTKQGETVSKSQALRPAAIWKRLLTRGVLLVLASIVVPVAAHAQAQTTGKTITFVVTYPAGGGADLIARLFAVPMAETLGQSIVVDNRPGASGQIGAGFVAKAAPDGTTVMVDASSFAINPARYPKLPYDPKAFRALGIPALFPHVLVVNTDFPAKSVQEFVARAKAEPGKITYASNGPGSAQHLAGSLFLMRTGTEMVHVPYRGGGPAMNDVMGGHVSSFFANVASSLTFIQAGRLRALGLAGERRLSSLPDVPTLAEVGVKGAELYEWNGFFAPPGTPDDIVNRLAAALDKAKQSAEIRARIAALGGELFAGGAAEASKFVASETERMAVVVKAADIKPE